MSSQLSTFKSDAKLFHLPCNLSCSEITLLKTHAMKEKRLKANGSEDLKCQKFSNFCDCIYPVFLVMWIHLLLLPPVQQRKHKMKTKLRCKEIL